MCHHDACDPKTIQNLLNIFVGESKESPQKINVLLDNSQRDLQFFELQQDK